MNVSRISIDFWNTMFKSNPDYKVKRNEFLADYLKLKIPVKSIDTVYEDVKKYCNDNEFKYGITVPMIYKHHLLMRSLSVNVDLVNADYFKAMHGMFFDHPPILVNDAIPSILKDWTIGHNVALISNTGMIPSSTLDSFINEVFYLEDELFEIRMHSDENRHCKPNKVFFEEYLEKSECPTARYWIHIGDDFQRDIQPVKDLEGRAYLITQPSDWDNLNTLIC